MSEITIQCRLVANEETLRYLWELMVQKNTPLIDELFARVGSHNEFEKWFKAGSVPEDEIKALCDSLKTQERFAGQPGRFYTSAITCVREAYASWVKLQKQRQWRLLGKERWLTVLKSDAELQQESNCSLDVICTKANEVLTQVAAQPESNKNQQTKSKKSNKPKIGKKAQTETATPKLFDLLFDAYDKAEEPLTRCALAYLLKNNCQANTVKEDTEQLALRQRTAKIEIERLKAQMKSRRPKGRDLTGEQCCIPYPVSYGSNTDVSKWFKNDKGRIFVQFNGLGKHVFEVYCDSRQLHWFQRFVEDWQIWHPNKETYCSGKLTLRSARLVWQEKKGKGKPWNIHWLALHCSIETRVWTDEGTEQVRLEKIAQADKTISNMTQKDELNKNQQLRLKSEQSKRERLNNPFPNRPSKPLYQGQSHILVGVSLGLKKPATVAVVDASKNKVLIYRTVKQLLGDNYKLLNRQRQQQQRLSHERHKAQKQNAPNSFGESELGKYVDRLLAVSIVAIAKTYSAGSIVLPGNGSNLLMWFQEYALIR